MLSAHQGEKPFMTDKDGCFIRLRETSFINFRLLVGGDLGGNPMTRLDGPKKEGAKNLHTLLCRSRKHSNDYLPEKEKNHETYQ